MFEINNIPEIKPFYIGKIKIKNPLILAPMAGITDLSFRRIIKSMGAGLVYSEMISCQAIHYNNKKTWELARLSDDEQPVAVQIFGSEPELMAEAAKKIEASGAKIIDINLGCSVPKVAKAGAGAALCRDLKNTARVLEAVVNAVKVPVTIKLRKGWTLDEITAFEICRMAQELGVSAIAIHGRTSSQKYTGLADWEFIGELKKRAKIPIIGNGDIKTPEQALHRLESSGCDAVMIGRESYYNPWIFRDAMSILQGLPQDSKPDVSDIKALIIYQLEDMAKNFGRQPAVDQMRKFMAWYTRGLRNSARFRDIVFQHKDYDTVVKLIDEYFESIYR